MSKSSLTQLKQLSLEQVKISDPFWGRYLKLVKEVVIPYQYDVLHDRVSDAAPSYAIRNFRIAAGREEGEFKGMVFQDSDVAKWLEAVGYSLMLQPDPQLEAQADEIIDLIAEAQQEDGYLHTYFIIQEPLKRWTNLVDCHELYCAGHLIEAGVAYFEATGKRKILDVICKLADHIDQTFGPEEGKIRGYDGHQEIELALIKLYRVTRNEKYLKLSSFFIDERGQEPSFFQQEWEKRGGVSHWTKTVLPINPAYHQSHLPVREQKEAIGHAVRAVYMYTAMADLVKYTEDEELLQACRTLWRNIVQRQMYITGGIGSTHHGEAFTFDYDLPNDTVYAETCASIGLIFFAQRMLQIEVKGEYADVMERALYNTVTAGMSLDGKHYFYVNPLEVWPKACTHNPGKHHVKPERPGWYDCACCPPNVARLLSSLGHYMFTTDHQTLFTHLYIGGTVSCELSNQEVEVTTTTNYPWDGKIQMSIQLQESATFSMALRMPGWCEDAILFINGEEIAWRDCLKDGYIYIEREWHNGDKIRLELEMKGQRIYAHPEVRYNAGKVAIQRGPLVYCLEEIDNLAPLTSLLLPRDSELIEEIEESILTNSVIIKAEGFREDLAFWGTSLYQKKPTTKERAILTFIPYFMWANRGKGEMTVWIREA